MIEPALLNPLVYQALAWGEKTLSANGFQNSQMESLWLLAENDPASSLLVRGSKSLDSEKWNRYRANIEDRIKGKPLAYILGNQDFMGHNFLVNDCVLIPRPETAILVNQALGHANQTGSCRRILEIGTGSGIIAILLAKKIPYSTITAVDISPEALKIAEKNSSLFGLEERINFIRSDLTASVAGEFDMIVSNPPYISTEELPALKREIGHEPEIALVGGPGGLSVIEKILKIAPQFLKKDCPVLVEVGHNQSKIVKDIMKESGLSRIRTSFDDSGIERVVAGFKE